MRRGISSWLFAGLASIFLLASIITQWGYSQIFSTDTFVATANTVIAEPVVQEEVASALIESLTTDISLPPLAVRSLEKLATRIVASDLFGEFWSNALRAAHEPLVTQLTSDTPITQLQAQRINLEPLAQSILNDLRAEFPQLAELLPATAPSASLTLLSGDSLQSARDATSLVQQLRWMFPVMTIALMAAAFFVQPTGNRRIRLIVISVAAAALVVFLATRVAGPLASSFVSDQYSDMTTTIAHHIVQPLTTQSLILLALCATASATLFIRSHRVRERSTD